MQGYTFAVVLENLPLYLSTPFLNSEYRCEAGKAGLAHESMHVLLSIMHISHTVWLMCITDSSIVSESWKSTQQFICII